jgi:hypothetical protein
MLAFGLANCSDLVDLDNETTQYIVVKKGDQLRPVAKVVYKVFINRQEIVYWVEFPGQGRSELYKLRKCIIFDRSNWEGEPDFLSWLLPEKVKFHDGKFQDANSVSWWTWYYETEPGPGYFSKLLRVGIGFGIAMTVIIIIAVIIALIQEKLSKKKKIELIEKDLAKDITKFTRTQREEFKKSGNIK